MYHTQDYRGRKNLKAPIFCNSDDAWLGEGYYFWYDILDAHFWGVQFKYHCKEYAIYDAKIDFEDVLDTVFNEEHYLYWLEELEKIYKRLIRIKSGVEIDLKLLNTYLIERGGWSKILGVKGLLFQDLPSSEQNTRFIGLYSRKRIQVCVYDTAIITDFKLCDVVKI